MDELAAFNIRYYQALYAWTYKKNLAEAAKLFESLLGDLNKSNPVSVTRITMFSYISLANIYKSTGEYQKSIDAGLGSFDYVSKLPGDTKANVEAYLNEPTSESVNKSVLGTLWNLVPNKSFSWDLWNLVGSDYEQLKNYDQAIAAYQKALAISDDPALRQKIEELSKKK
jgi:tetratricopeptide (TPR) repeat protein